MKAEIKISLKRLFGAAVLALTLPVAVCAGEESGPEIGQPSPNLVGRTLNDSSYRLKNDKGSPKVVNFFWIGCKPCRQEMPELAKLEKQYPGVKFISVHTQEEKPEAVAKFVKSLSGAPSNIVLTSGGLQEIFHYLGLPHTVVMDRDNVVLMNLSGYTPDNMRALNKELQHLTK
jgi:thiol-disulfide isomerase/thioredoxin